ncbi:MAG: hypothetical protein ACNA77_01425 [Opitutales bacterium]
MRTSFLKLSTFVLLAGAVSMTACGKNSESGAESSTNSEAAKLTESPDGAIQFIAQELAKGNGAVLWQAMPASYQQDVNSIAQLAGTKIDAEIYDRIFALLGRISNAFDQQKEFVFGSSMIPGQTNEASAAQMREAWPSITNLIQTLTSSPLASASGLKSFDGAAFFKGTVSDLLADVDALAKLDPEREGSLLASLREIQVKVLEGTESKALLEISMPGEEVETETFVKFEERWVPQEMATGWTEQIAGARTQLEALDPAQFAKQKPQILAVFAMFDGVLAQIEAAKTQEQFDQAIQGAMMPIMGLMMMGQGMGGGAAPAMPGADDVLR